MTSVYELSKHATERIRQRVGISSIEAATQWANELISKAAHTKRDGHKLHYITEHFEIVCDKETVVTVKPTEKENQYFAKVAGIIKRELTKDLQQFKREYRKAEIAVAELTLNLLKARNPNTKQIINERLTQAIDNREKINDEITKINLTAYRYSIEV